MYTTVIFDMDGTLFNAESFVVDVINSTIKELNNPKLSEVDIDDVRSALGKPALEYYATMFKGLDYDELEQAIKVCKHYEKTLMSTGGGSLYSGAHELLDSLYKRGITLALATNSGLTYMTSVLTNFGIDKYFTYTLCAETNGGMKKTDMLREIISLTSKPHIMVGDRLFDFHAAQDNGIDFIACDYGYSDIPEDLPGIKARVSKLLDIEDYVLNS